MSTVHEAVTAKHCGIRVFAFSLITNACVTDHPPKKSSNQSIDLQNEVFDVAKKAEGKLKDFVSALLPAFARTL